MKKIFIFITVFASVICCLCFTASAEDYNNDFFDFDQYAKYTADSSTGLINAKITLPEEWFYTFSFDGDGFGAWYNGYNFDTIVSKTPISWQFNRFARANNTGSRVGSQLRNAHFIDLQYLPYGTSLHEELIITTLTDHQISAHGLFMACYVDSDGVVVFREDIAVEVVSVNLSDGGKKHTLSLIYNFNNVPTNAVGFYYIMRLTTGLAQVDDIPTIVNNTTFTFSYSELDFNIKQQQVIRDKVSNIEQQLGDLINRPLDPGIPPGQNDFDDLHNNEQELLDQSQNYLDNGLSFFQNAGGAILGLSNGFEAIKLLVQPVFALPFANSLITVSVSLGLVATLIGVFISSISNGGNEKKAGKDGKQASSGGKKSAKGGK